MTETLHPQVSALLERYRRELADTHASDALDARIGRLVANSGEMTTPRASRLRRATRWAAAAGLAGLAIAAGIAIGMRLERRETTTQLVQQEPASPEDFSLWPTDSVALQIPAEYSANGTLVAVDPGVHSTGKRYWIDVVVSNDGTVRIDRIVPAETVRNKGMPHGFTFQTP